MWRTGKALQTQTFDDPKSEGCWSVEFSKDGSQLFVGLRHEQTSLRVFDWNNESKVLTEHEKLSSEPVRCLTLSPDGQLLAGTHGQSNKTTIWRLPDFTPIITLAERDVANDIDVAMDTCVFSPCGSHLAVNGSSKTTLWQVATGKMIAEMPVMSMGFDVSWSPDGTRIATAEINGTVNLWDWTTKQQVSTFRGQACAFFARWKNVSGWGEATFSRKARASLRRVTLYQR